MLVVGLLLLAAAGIVGVAGVAANTGSEHQLAGGFAIFGYHVHGSSGKLFLAGLLIGAVGMLGFIMATEGLRRNAALRRELFRFRRQARAQVRPATAAPQPPDRVLARTAPPPTSDMDATSVVARSGPSTGISTGTAAKGTGTAATSTAPNASAKRSGWRRALRNWRTPRPTS